MSRPPLEVLWLWAALVLPSWAVVDKWLHVRGLVVYSIAAAVALLFAPRLFAAIPRRACRAFGIATVLALIVAFLAIYPVVNTSGAYSGSDDDDAHNAGVAALLAGETPYSRTTYLGNELHQLPGSYVLAAPFAMVWTSALQNLFWLPLFFVALRQEVSDPRTPLVLAWLVLAISPAVLHQVVTGSSYSWNAITVLLGMWWLLRRPSSTLAAVALGVAMCSRPNFLFLMPLAFAALGRGAGWPVAVRQTAIAGGVAAALALPFYFMSPEFGPLNGWERLNRYDEIVPFAGAAILVAMGASAIWLAAGNTSRLGVFRHSAVVQVLPVAAGLILTIGSGAGDVTATAYASFASWFAVMGVAPRLEPWLAGNPS
jgi:hypothetical protein